MEPPEAVAMSPGEVLTFTLPGLGGAGYLWYAVSSGPAVTVTVERGSPERRDPGPHAVGAARPETLRITANAPGGATIDLTQRRPWEHGPPRAVRHTDVVVVQPLDEPPRSEDTQGSGGSGSRPLDR